LLPEEELQRQFKENDLIEAMKNSYKNSRYTKRSWVTPGIPPTSP
jgi:hypothetical protein